MGDFHSEADRGFDPEDRQRVDRRYFGRGDFTSGALSDVAAARIASNLTVWLYDNVPEGREAYVAINHELRAILVFCMGEPILCASFDELARRPGASLN
jgi:hypothetical protein